MKYCVNYKNVKITNNVKDLKYFYSKVLVAVLILVINQLKKISL